MVLPSVSGARNAISSCKCISTTIHRSPPAGRFGISKKYAHPKLEIVKDTLTGTLEYAGQLVAMGTMGYKHEAMAGNGERTTAMRPRPRSI